MTTNKGLQHLRTDIRLLIGCGVGLALVGALLSPSEKAFTLISTTSSTLIGAGVGILRERSELEEENSKKLTQIKDLELQEYYTTHNKPPSRPEHTYPEEY